MRRLHPIHRLAFGLIAIGNACRGTVEPITLEPAPQVTGFTLIAGATGDTIEPVVDGQTIDLALLPTRDLGLIVEASGAADAVEVSYDSGPRLEHCAPFSIKGDTRGQVYCWDPPLGGLGVHKVAGRPGRRCGSGAIWGETRGITFMVTDSGGGAAFSCGERTAPLGPVCDLSTPYPDPNAGSSCAGNVAPPDGGGD